VVASYDACVIAVAAITTTTAAQAVDED